MFEINVNIDRGYPKIFIKDSLSEPYQDDDDYSDRIITVGPNGINILCQPACEEINRLVITINDPEDHFDEILKYYNTYPLNIPSEVVVVQDDATTEGTADNTYMALKCNNNVVTIRVFLDDFVHPSIIGIALSTPGGNGA